MGKDPAFLFYPGDYLRDTQCLSENAQVAYDRIMCEHMRNMCISEQQLNFFEKKLSPAEMMELEHVLTKTDDGYFISWVYESISKRKAYSKSRAKNRLGKSNKEGDNISTTYVSHMENENVIGDKNETKGGAGGKLSREEELAGYQKFTDDILAHNDQHFEQLAAKDRVDITEDAVKDHLALLHRYPNMQPNSVTEFRQSLIKHCKDFKLKKDVPTKPRRIGTLDLDAAERELQRARELDEQIRAKNFAGP